MKLVEPPSCSSASTIVFIGKNKRGQWVAQERVEPYKVRTCRMVNEEKVEQIPVTTCQMVAEELGVGVDRIALIEGDTALTPDQGGTGGSTGVQVGGVTLRRAAATARQALIQMAATRLQSPAAELEAIDGEIRQKAGGAGISFSELIGDRGQARRWTPRS